MEARTLNSKVFIFFLVVDEEGEIYAKTVDERFVLSNSTYIEINPVPLSFLFPFGYITSFLILQKDAKISVLC